jgi:translation elongation factor EF-G
MDIFNKWFDDLLKGTSAQLPKEVQVIGECKKRAGPRPLYAKVTLSFSASNKFEIESLLDADTYKIAQNEDWHNSILFGVLDVFLTQAELPIRNFKVIIHSIEFSETDSTPIAFRLAARNAASSALSIFFKRTGINNTQP